MKNNNMNNNMTTPYPINVEILRELRATLEALTAERRLDERDNRKNLRENAIDLVMQGIRELFSPPMMQLESKPAPPTLPSVTMLLIDPMLNYFKWAIVDGNVLRRQGASSSFEGIKEIAAREAIVDVFIYEGYRAKEVREAAAKNGWHCVRVNSTKERGSIALLLDEACNLDVARIRKPSRVDDLLAQVDSLSRELKRQLSVEEIVAAIVQFDTLKEGNA